MQKRLIVAPRGQARTPVPFLCREAGAGIERVLRCRSGDGGDAMGFAAFADKKYLNLETFRKNGEGVRTPVWFVADPATNLDSPDAKLYVYTIGVSGKVKRIRNNPRVRIAPCDARGTVLGEWADARVETVTGSEAEHGVQLLNRKYFPWKQILAFFALFSRRERIVFVLRPR